MMGTTTNPRNARRKKAGAAMLALLPAVGFASGIPTGTPLEEIVVTARRIGLVGESRAASEGVVTRIQIEGRPLMRVGEILEVVPGLVVTQHTGDGKANQYYLRGFNLDHGTDFAVSVEDIPVNMPTHAHGQGYADINFVIPELLEEVRYRKGPYFADHGNFSAAGAAELIYRRSVDAPEALLVVGQDNYLRTMLAASPELAGGPLLMALDYSTNDGPWTLPEDFRKLTGLVRYSQGDADGGYAVTGMGYDGEWDSTDQIPRRATRSRCEEIPFCIDRFGYVDPTSGGNTHRYSLSLDGWSRSESGHEWRANAYVLDYHLDLFSNFTYAIDQGRGDQFYQYDDRLAWGGRYDAAWPLAINDLAGVFKSGVQLRVDDIAPVALYLTTGRERWDTVRRDEVRQANYSAYVAHDQRWADWFRTELGLRYDYFDFSVDSSLKSNSGDASDDLWQPKLTMIFGPWHETEYFLNFGRGFHANDARGTTITVDPSDGVTPVDKVDPIVAADGAEIGFRSGLVPGLQFYGAFWGLDIDSELLFVGDGGYTEASRGTRRYGVELGAYWTPLEWLVLDTDYAWSHARFTDPDPAGDHVPGAVETVISVGLSIDRPDGWFGGARLRYFGKAPLIEDGGVSSDATTLVNLEAGYRFREHWRAFLTVFNLFDAEANDISYYYESRLPGETAPVQDIHFHPVEPRTFRLNLGLSF